jgi:hypothetical protein
MSKITVRAYRKDEIDSHVHKLPDGSYTQPPLLKPNKDRTFPHTHLYVSQGKTLETGLAEMGGDHTHITEIGMTSGPVAEASERKDSIDRIGTSWVVRSETGAITSRHFSKEDAEKQLKSS